MEQNDICPSRVRGLSVYHAFPMSSRLHFQAKKIGVVKPNEGHGWVPELLLGRGPSRKDVGPSLVCISKKCLLCYFLFGFFFLMEASMNELP